MCCVRVYAHCRRSHAFNGSHRRHRPRPFHRIFAKLRDWRLASLAVVGTAPLPGVTYVHTTRAGAAKTLPVLPSDHFGLLLTLEPV